MILLSGVQRRVCDHKLQGDDADLTLLQTVSAADQASAAGTEPAQDQGEMLGLES